MVKEAACLGAQDLKLSLCVKSNGLVWEPEGLSAMASKVRKRFSKKAVKSTKVGKLLFVA